MSGVQPRRSGPVGVGFIGTGMISDTYLEHLTRFPDVNVIILGNRHPDRARAQAAKHAIAEWGGTENVLTHPDGEPVVNLTIPSAHAAVASSAIAAGKHVWSEKPISVDRSSAAALLEEARSAGVLVGVAPDTVLGPGLQTARRAISRGDIGRPLSAQTVIQYPGPDVFHPNPGFCSPREPGRSTTKVRTSSPPWSMSSDPSPSSRSLHAGGTPRASGQLAYHVLDAIIAMDDSIKLGQAVDVRSTADAIPLMDEAWDPYEATL
jgi:hypothetical protein